LKLVSKMAAKTAAFDSNSNPEAFLGGNKQCKQFTID